MHGDRGRVTELRMEGRNEGRMDGWMDKWTDRWMDCSLGLESEVKIKMESEEMKASSRQL